MHKQVAYQTVGRPPPRHMQDPNRVTNTCILPKKILYIAWTVIVSGTISKNQGLHTYTFDLYRVENHISRLCTTPLGPPPPPLGEPPAALHLLRGNGGGHHSFAVSV